MDTECSVSKLQFQGLGRRRVEAEFNGGQITSDAGGLLLREVESRYGFISGLAACFGDRRDASPSSVWRSWWGSGFMDWPWAMRMSTIIRSCGRIR